MANSPCLSKRASSPGDVVAGAALRLCAALHFALLSALWRPSRGGQREHGGGDHALAASVGTDDAVKRCGMASALDVSALPPASLARARRRQASTEHKNQRHRDPLFNVCCCIISLRARIAWHESRRAPSGSAPSTAQKSAAREPVNVALGLHFREQPT